MNPIHSEIAIGINVTRAPVVKLKVGKNISVMTSRVFLNV